MTSAKPDIRIIILAGGQGTRFWPVSRVDRPKQFLSVREDGESLIQATVRRVRCFSDDARMLVVTNTKHVGLVREHLPSVSVLAEPIGRNTAASIALAAMKLAVENPRAVMVILSADHAIADESGLVEILREASSHAAASEDLVIVGIAPDSPHTGYGYIRRAKKINGRIYKVASFVEKPKLDIAKSYLASGDYSWNSGMFIWRVDVFLRALEQLMPNLYQALSKLQPLFGSPKFEAALSEVFPTLESVPVDTGILERANNCVMVAAPAFGWSDVGSWDSWAQHFKPDSAGNILRGDALSIDSRNSIVVGDKKLIAIVGVDDLVVVDSGDAILVCPRSRSQDVKKVVEALVARGRKDLL